MTTIKSFLKALLKTSDLRYCQILTNMNPPKVSDMGTAFDRERFTKCISIPTITFQQENQKTIGELVKALKKFFLKIEKFQPVSSGKIYLNPDLIHKMEDLPAETLECFDINLSKFQFEDIEITYQNWSLSELVKAIIPEDLEPPTSYSKIGHILHINLKDNLLPYKTSIAQIYMDKVPGCRTVINKAQSIDNIFRNFQIDLLMGDADYQVQVKENGVMFDFDFSTVYWNPRLSSEHERLVKLLKPNDFLYDIFAGVGPFAVPAGKKRVNVLANDLNPHSFKWLEHNVKKNKVSNYVTSFNKDGRDFILQDIKNNLLERIEKRDVEMIEYSIHITMNLPGLAATFLDAFVGLLKNNEKGIKSSSSIPKPVCHCYCFVKGIEDPKIMAQSLAEENLGIKLLEGKTLQGIHFVRNVAPNKNMMRVDIILTSELLFNNFKHTSEGFEESNPNKKQCK